MLKIITPLLIAVIPFIQIYAAMEFDGVDDRIEAPDSNSLDLPGQFTIQVWFKTDDATKNQHLINKTDFGQNKRCYHCSWYGPETDWILSLSVDGQTGDPHQTYYRFDDTVVNDQWYHVIFLYNRNSGDNNRIKCYVNGQSLSPTVIDDNAITPDNNDLPLKIGIARSSGTYSSCMDGQLTECAIWETVLTEKEILQLYNAKVKRMPLQIRPDKLVGYWPLDDIASGETGNGFPFSDLSTYRNNGTGNWGANASGLSGKAEEVLSYPAN